MAAIDLTEDNDSSTCAAAVGDEIALTLPETPTSGYRWTIERLDAGVLELVDDAYSPPEPGLLGGKGEHRWTFRVVGPGSTPLRLELKRIWDAESAVSSFEATIDASA